MGEERGGGGRGCFLCLFKGFEGGGVDGGVGECFFSFFTK